MFFLLTELVAGFLLVDLLALSCRSNLFNGLDLSSVLNSPKLPPHIILRSVLDFNHPSPFYNLFVSPL